MPTIHPPVRSDHDLVSLRFARLETRLPGAHAPGEFDAEHMQGAYGVPLNQRAEHSGEIRAATRARALVGPPGQRASTAEQALAAAQTVQQCTPFRSLEQTRHREPT